MTVVQTLDFTVTLVYFSWKFYNLWGITFQSEFHIPNYFIYTFTTNVFKYVHPYQPLTTMPECSQTSRRQRPDYLADFTSGSSVENSCSSSNEDEEERRKTGGGGGSGEKREKKVSYDLGSKDKNLAERSGKVIGCFYGKSTIHGTISCISGVSFHGYVHPRTHDVLHITFI